MMLKILILSYSFNETHEIGGKRWFNLSKSLSLNCNVDVISSSLVDKPIWVEELFYVKSNYPAILNKTPSTILEKIHYKVSLYKQFFCFAGSPYDKGKNNCKKVKDLIIKNYKKKKYDIIISSGAPFSWLVIVPKLKRNNFIQNKTIVLSDFRDPWTWGQGYGMTTISERRISFEKYQEKFTVNFSDIILVPSKSMFSHLINKYSKSNIFHLPHGFDKISIDKILKSLSKSKNDKLNIIYGGNWYDGNSTVLNQLTHLLSKIQDEIEINIFTSLNSYKNYKYKNVNINFSNYTSEKILFKKIYNADFYLLILPKRFSDFLSAKFFEICSLKVPIIYIGKKGLVSNFILSNKIGFHLDLNEFNIEFFNVKYSDLSNNILNEHSFDNLSNLLMSEIIKVKT